MWVVEPTLGKVTWERPSVKMVKLMPVGWKAAGPTKSRVESVPGAWQRKREGPKWKRVRSVLEGGRRHAGWGRVSRREDRRDALGRGGFEWLAGHGKLWDCTPGGWGATQGFPSGQCRDLPRKVGPGPCHCPGRFTTWGLGAGPSGPEAMSEQRGVGSDTRCVGHQFPGPEDEPQPRQPGRLASLPSHVLVPYGKLRLEKALGFLSSPCPGCCRRVRGSVLPGLRLGRRDIHSGAGVSKLQAHVPFQTLLKKRCVSQCLSYRRTCSDHPHFPLCQYKEAQERT